MYLTQIRKPTTPEDFGRAIWELIDRSSALQLLESNTVHIGQKLNGVTLDVKPSFLSGVSDIGVYLVKVVKSDYLECSRVVLNSDGTFTESDTIEEIAKPFSFQYHTNVLQSIGGYTWQSEATTGTAVNQTRDMQDRVLKVLYTDANVLSIGVIGSRTGMQVEIPQELNPKYVADDVILAVKTKDVVLNLPAMTADDGTHYDAKQLKAIDLNVCGRHWAERFCEVMVCIDGTPYLRLMRSTQPFAIPA